MIPRNSAIFGSRHSIDSNSAVSNSADSNTEMIFLDKNAPYSRTYCMYTEGPRLTHILRPGIYLHITQFFWLSNQTVLDETVLCKDPL